MSAGPVAATIRMASAWAKKFVDPLTHSAAGHRITVGKNICETLRTFNERAKFRITTVWQAWLYKIYLQRWEINARKTHICFNTTNSWLQPLAVVLWINVNSCPMPLSLVCWLDEYLCEMLYLSTRNRHCNHVICSWSILQICHPELAV